MNDRRGLLLSVLLVLCSGCAATLQNGEPSIAELRRQAAASPRDPLAARALLLGELFGRDGDARKADALLARTATLDAGSSRSWFAIAAAHDTHGQPARALRAYLQVVKTSLGDADALASRLAEVSIRSIGNLASSAPDYAAQVEPALSAAIADPRMPLPARFAATSVLMELSARRGDREATQRLAAQVGCIAKLRVAGPFGPRDLLGFDVEHAARPGKPLAATYDLGPGRGEMPTRDVGARACGLNLGGGPLADGGTSYAQTYIDVAQAGPHLIRLQTQSSTELFVDGRSVLRLDRRRQLIPDTQFVPLVLSAGRHEITIKLSTRHPNPVIALALAPQRAVDGSAVELPFNPAEREGFAVYTRAAVAVGRGDVLSARQILDGIAADKPAAALLLAMRAQVLALDPLVPANMREDESRRLLETSLTRDPKLWAPNLQLAGMMAGNGRTKEAIAALRKSVAQWREVPAVGLLLAQLLRAQRWDAEADEVIADLRKRVPGACEPIAAELEALRARQREQKAEVATEALLRCDARSNARYAMLLRQRRFPDAQRELERLAGLDPAPNSYPWLVARLELAKQRGDAGAVQRHIRELRTGYPRSANAALEEVDQLAGSGDDKAALAALTRAIAQEPASLATLQRVVPLLGGQHVLAGYRVDGRKVVERFEKSGRQYDAPSVLVFDYMATRIYDDGSALELVHTIQKAQSHEAVDELGEVQVPEGARVLTLRALKSDGRQLEPDQIEGKDTISLPTVAPGDYVEFEYLQNRDPSEAFPGGYAGERFYFKSFEVPFDQSRMIVIAPKDFPLQNDPRGSAPEPEQRIEGDLRILDFHVEQSTPLRVEPGAVAAREYLPSVRLGARATWEGWIESLREGLRDRDLYDPEIAALVQQIVGDADPGDVQARAERLYSWVLANVENNDDVFSQASVMLRARSGNRARVLRYMLGLAGVPATLGLVRSGAGDNTPSNMADDDTFEHLLVAFQGPRGPTWLFTVERHAPFGYLPPLLRGQPALLLAPGAPRVTLPDATRGEDLRRLVLDVELDDDGSAKIEVRETVYGAGAVRWRAELESIPAAELEHRFGEEYAGRLIAGARLTSLKIQGREQQSPMLELIYGLEVANFGRRLGNRWALPPLLSANLSQGYAQLSERTTDALVPNPLELEVTVRVRVPSGLRVLSAPESARVQAALSGLPTRATQPRFTMTSRNENGRVITERKLDLPAMRIGVPAYGEFSEFCRKVDLVESKELILGE